MSKLKVNSGLLSLVLVACLFSGWTTMLTVAVLILIFCEIDEKVKNILIKVLSFFIAITLFSLLWELISSGVNLGINSITKLVDIINSYLDYGKTISLTKLELYLFGPVRGVIGIVDSVISYILTFVKFSFIVSIFLNKSGKTNFIIKKIEEYVNNIVNFVSSFGTENNYQSQSNLVSNQSMYNQPQQNQVQQNFNQPNM